MTIRGRCDPQDEAIVVLGGGLERDRHAHMEITRQLAQLQADRENGRSTVDLSVA